MRPTPFLITGLPRSRTAWMASAATATDGNAVCYHEPLAVLSRWQDVFDVIWGGEDRLGPVLQGYSAAFVGIADHGLGFHLPAIMARIAPRTLIIERPIAEVKAALAALGLPASNFCDLLAEALAFQHPRIRRVPYAALADTAVVLDCLGFLTPGARGIDARRIDTLQTRNIQADFAETMRLAAERAPDMAAFLPPDVLARLRLTGAAA